MKQVDVERYTRELNQPMGCVGNDMVGLAQTTEYMLNDRLTKISLLSVVRPSLQKSSVQCSARQR